LTLAEFLPSDEAQRFWRVSVPKALQDGSRVDEGLFLARNGRLFPVSRQVLAHRGNNGVARQLSIIARDITQAKEVEKELRESKFFLNSLLQSIPAPVFYKDTQGRYLGVNRAFETFYGRSHDDIVGKTVFEVAPVEFARVYHQKDLELFEQPGPQVYECQAGNAGGDVRDVVYHEAPIMNAAGVVTGLVGVILDITERVRAEDQVRTLSRAIEQSPASIVITDPTGLIEYVNPTFTRVTGYSMAEVLHQNPRVLQSGEMPREVYQELWRTITAGQEWRGELQNRRKDGTLFWELASISPVHDPLGRITHYLAIQEDITERKRTERERNEMEIQLRHAQKLESIGQLAAGIAHEINTPTQYIGDNARFLKDAFADVLRLFDQYAKLEESAGCNPACAAALTAVQEAARTADLGYLVQEIPKALDQSLEGVDRVSRIVRAMKDFSHPGEEEKTSVDLRRAIESTLTVSRSEWKYVAELVTEFDPEPPLLAKTHEGRALTPPEAEMLSRVPEIGAELLVHIPRLAPVAEIIRYRSKHYDGSGTPTDSVAGDAIPIGSRILKVLSDMLDLEAQGFSRGRALQTLQTRVGCYDPRVLDAVFACFDVYLAQPTPEPSVTRSVTVRELRPGDLLRSSLETRDGMLILAAGNEVSAVLLEKVRNFARLTGVCEPILVEAR
jgi:PAS domain S-box-containing protein